MQPGEGGLGDGTGRLCAEDLGMLTTCSKQCELELCLYSVSLDALLKETLGRHRWRGIGGVSICGLHGLHLGLRASSTAGNEPIHHL